MKTYAGFLTAAFVSLSTAACHLQTSGPLDSESTTANEDEEGPSTCSTSSECGDEGSSDDGSEQSAEGAGGASSGSTSSEGDDSCTAEGACETSDDECDPMTDMDCDEECNPETGAGCSSLDDEPVEEDDEPVEEDDDVVEEDEDSDTFELEVIVARPIEDDEPVRATYCGSDKEELIRYNAECTTLEKECKEAGGVFLCHDQKPSAECLTWGGCHFLSLQAKPVEPGPIPEELDKAPKGEDGLADVSVFECGEDEFCCLFVPGAGDASADCGGFLSNCESIGCSPSGGSHVAGCQC